MGGDNQLPLRAHARAASRIARDEEVRWPRDEEARWPRLVARRRRPTLRKHCAGDAPLPEAMARRWPALDRALAARFLLAGRRWSSLCAAAGRPLCAVLRDVAHGRASRLARRVRGCRTQNSWWRRRRRPPLRRRSGEVVTADFF
ncbi:hypothetical protein F511_46939 [Dorcoceras hygrometricum]|uniref:Uncharacterized protein n=1 Tax=Dorcoceras hygrometricum TaxID=472368 RepID=A0A2Z6ZS85_9LAMI|nr:hypothetical protein F511_46939 [Dorcoceras hygrometricum]